MDTTEDRMFDILVRIERDEEVTREDVEFLRFNAEALRAKATEAQQQASTAFWQYNNASNRFARQLKMQSPTGRKRLL